MSNRGWAAAAWRGFVRVLWALRETGRALWMVVRAPIVAALQIIAALIVLFEEWGWKPLSDLLSYLARFAPLAAVERWIARLPPYGALAVFLLPSAFLFPLKFLAMWLLATGKYWTATALFAGAKVASTALVARIFMLTKPTLMQIGWFARAYNWFVPWKDALFAQIRASWVWRYGRMIKTSVRAGVKRFWLRWRPAVIEITGRIRRKIADLSRRAVQAARHVLGV